MSTPPLSSIPLNFDQLLKIVRQLPTKEKPELESMIWLLRFDFVDYSVGFIHTGFYNTCIQNAIIIT